MKVQKKVLLLDDEPIVCERLKPALEKLGFCVEAYTDSQQALARASEESFDVLVTDLKMPKPDGLQVMDLLRSRSPALKVIVITGFATVETARATMKSGAVDILAKPFRIRELCDLITKVTQDS